MHKNWTSPESNISQSISCTDTYLPSQKNIQIRRTRHAGLCWRSKDKLTRDILLWTPSHGRARVRWSYTIYLQQLGTDAECSLEDLPGEMDDRDGWRERVREIPASGTHDDDVDIYIIRKNTGNRHLAIINLFQLATPYENPTSSEKNR